MFGGFPNAELGSLRKTLHPRVDDFGFGHDRLFWNHRTVRSFSEETNEIVD